MPAHLIPRNSGLHRIAAIALYRALLIQAQRTPALLISQRDELQNLIRTRFKQARFDTSQRHLKLRFAAGYEALDILDTAIAARDTDTVVSLLARANPAAKQSPPTVLPKHLRREQAKRERQRQAETTRARVAEQTALFERPLPLEQLSGRRHVPVLVRANFVPMLRVKKPQPEALSRYIRQRVKIRRRRHDRKQALTGELQVARWEDEWDELVMEVGNRKDAGERGASIENERRDAGQDMSKWRYAVGEALHHTWGYLSQENDHFKAMAQKMQGVVDRERALYDQEKATRVRQKKEAFFARVKAKKLEQKTGEAEEISRTKEIEDKSVGTKQGS